MFRRKSGGGAMTQMEGRAKLALAGG